jgi:hypothetical protein
LLVFVYWVLLVGKGLVKVLAKGTMKN